MYFPILLLIFVVHTCSSFEPEATVRINLNSCRNSSHQQSNHSFGASERYLYNQSLYQLCFAEPRLNNYSVDQLAQHFAQQGYSAEQILKHHDLYSNSEFVKLIKAYTGYEQYITTLNKQLQQKSAFAKWIGTFTGTYVKGLTRRVAELCKEVEQQRSFKNLAAQRAQYILHTVQSTTVDSATLLFASKYGITEEHLLHRTRNAYKNQLHQEFVTQLFEGTKLAEIYKSIESYSIFLDALGLGIAIGIQANQSYNIVAATKWADYGWAVLDAIKGISEGIILGASNTVNSLVQTVSHPIQTAHQIVHGIGTIAYFLAQATGTALKLERLVDTADYTTFSIESKELSDQLNRVTKHCSDQLALMSHREITKRTVAFGTELVLTGKVLTMAHNICSHLTPRMLDAVKILCNEGVAIEFTVTTAEGIKESSPLVLFTEKEPELKKISQVILTPAPKIVSKSVRTVIPTWVDIKSLMKKFEGRCLYNGQSVCVDCEHLFSISEICRIKRSGHITDPRIHGWHHDYMKALEKIGIVQYENIVEGVCGAFRAEPVVNGIKYGKKTFFSPSWTEEKVVEQILEALQGHHNFFDIDTQGCHKIIGTTREGLDIQMIYDPQKSMITTAFPFMEQLNV